MKKHDILNDIREIFKDDIIDIIDKSDHRVYIEIKAEGLTRIAKYIFYDLAARFNTATGLDARNYMEILYHFTIEEINLLISLRVKLDKSKKLEIDSLASLFEAANWIEREIHEMLGVNFKGHPDLRKLLLSDDWPEGVHPLRCDYKEWDKKAIRDREA